MFTNKSRYEKTTLYEMIDRRGRVVKVVAVPEAMELPVIGFHLLQQGQRLDHLAAQYGNDPAGFWRICLANGVMLPEVLREQSEIAIPVKF